MANLMAAWTRTWAAVGRRCPTGSLRQSEEDSRLPHAPVRKPLNIALSSTCKSKKSQSAPGYRNYAGQGAGAGE